MITNPWILCGIGTLFSFSGVYFFFKNVFEEGKSLKWPIILMLMGVFLIGLGTYYYVYNPVPLR
jgi:hypothetical protein